MSSAEFDAVTFPLIALIGALALGIGVTLIFRAVVPPMLARTYHAGDAEKRTLVLLREGYEIRNRVRTLQKEADRLEAQRARLDTEMRGLERKLAAADARPPDFVHEIGDPRTGPTRYVARVAVDAASPFLKPASDLYNPQWRYLNLAEIWATSRDHARQLLDLAYPDKLGYQKQFLDGPSGDSQR